MGVDPEAYHKPVSSDEYEAVTTGPACENMKHWLITGAAEPGQFAHRAEFLEALLKCDYRDNWENEWAERYFPLTADQWVNFTTIGSGYKLRHFEHSGLPFFQNKWKERYGIYVPDSTHVKLLLHIGTSPHDRSRHSARAVHPQPEWQPRVQTLGVFPTAECQRQIGS
jgi:hypothetical protein